MYRRGTSHLKSSHVILLAIFPLLLKDLTDRPVPMLMHTGSPEVRPCTHADAYWQSRS